MMMVNAALHAYPSVPAGESEAYRRAVEASFAGINTLGAGLLIGQDQTFFLEQARRLEQNPEISAFPQIRQALSLLLAPAERRRPN